MRHSPLRHLITATMALAFMATVAACGSASPEVLAAPETTATPAAPLPNTATPSTAAPTTTTRRATHSATSPPTVEDSCVPFRSEKGGYYEAGTISTEQLTAPNSRCTTISVSDVRDPDSRPPTDTCGYFKVAIWPTTGDGWPTYLEPVIACSSYRTVLARNVSNNARYLVTYDVEHFDTTADVMSHLTFRIWH
jgi:hypothetical protein